MQNPNVENAAPEQEYDSLGKFFVLYIAIPLALLTVAAVATHFLVAA